MRFFGVGGRFGRPRRDPEITQKLSVLSDYIAFLVPKHPRNPERSEAACPFNFRDVHAAGQEARHLQMAVEGRKPADTSMEPLPPASYHLLPHANRGGREPLETIKMKNARLFSTHGGRRCIRNQLLCNLFVQDLISKLCSSTFNK